MCRGYFYSQEIDPHHATEHRSTDQSRNGCGMCCFCHAQPFEITRAKNIKNTLLQRSCQNAEVVEVFCSRRVHHRDRHQHTIAIALAALPGATLPRLRALALFGRRPPQRVDSLLMPASENLHNRGSYRSLPEQRSPSSVFRFLPSRDSKVRLAICHSLCPIRVNARSRCAPARCAGARAERPVAGGRSRGQRWAQGQHAASRTNAAHQFTNRPLMNSVHLHARMHVASCSRRVHHRDRHQHTIPIALAALPGAYFPRLRALALFWTPAS